MVNSPLMSPVQSEQLNTKRKLLTLKKGDRVRVVWKETAASYREGFPVREYTIKGIFNQEVILNDIENVYIVMGELVDGTSDAYDAYLIRRRDE